MKGKIGRGSARGTSVGSSRGGARVTITLISCALILSLAVWYLFHILGMPLTSKDTPVVTGFCLLVTVFSRWIWNKFRQRSGKGAPQ